MKRIALLIFLALIPIAINAQSWARRGIKVGQNGTVYDSIVNVGGSPVMYTGGVGYVLNDSVVVALDYTPTSSVSPIEGRVYYDSDNNYLLLYNGVQWDTLNTTASSLGTLIVIDTIYETTEDHGVLIEQVLIQDSALILDNAGYLDQYGWFLKVGGDNPGGGDERTDNKAKLGGLKIPHYDIDEEDIGIISGLSGSTTTFLLIGGGSTIQNAATSLRFYAADNNTTLQGSNIAIMNTSGLQIDAISELTASNGVDIEGIHLEDGLVDTYALTDSIDNHTDTLQTHNIRINNNVDSLILHLDTLQTHNIRINNNVDSLSLHLDTLQTHNARINNNIDSLALHLDTLQAHNIRINNLADTAALHLDTLQSHNTRILSLESGVPTQDSSSVSYDYVPISSVVTTEGRVYYDSDDNFLKVYNGATWDNLNDAAAVDYSVYFDSAFFETRFGLTDDGSDMTTELQAVFDWSPAYQMVTLPRGEYNVSSTLNMKDGLSIDFNMSTINGTAIEDGSPILFADDDVDIVKIKNVIIRGEQADLDCDGIRLGNSGGAAYSSAQDYIENVRIYYCDTAFYHYGWTSRFEFIRINYCNVGIVAWATNDYDHVDINDIHQKDFAIAGGGGGSFTSWTVQNGTAADTSRSPSTIDDCKNITLEDWYMENSYDKDTVGILIGADGSTRVEAIRIENMEYGSNSDDGQPAVYLDSVFGAWIEGSFGSHFEAPVFTTEKARNVEVHNVMQNYKHIMDNGDNLGQAYNYMPNGDFEHWLAGWESLFPDNVTITKDTVFVKSGKNAARVTAGATTGDSKMEMWFDDNIEYLRGRKVKLSGWVYIPDSSFFQDGTSRALKPGMGFSSYNGGFQNDDHDYTYGMAGGWNYFESNLTVQDNATRIYVDLYLTQISATTTTDMWVVFDDIKITDQEVPTARLLNGSIPIAPNNSVYVEGGKLRWYSDAVENDVDQYFNVGDIIWNTAPVGEEDMGWLCTAAGTGATAVWDVFADEGAAGTFDSTSVTYDFIPTASVSTNEGRVYYDSDDDKLKVYTTTWEDLNGSSSTNNPDLDNKPSAYYISPSGSDSNDGSIESPWLTINKVNSEMGNFNGGDVIAFERGGVYRDTTLRITADSLIISAYGGGDKPVISGFKVLESPSDEGGGLYSFSHNSRVYAALQDGQWIYPSRWPDNRDTTALWFANAGVGIFTDTIDVDSIDAGAMLHIRLNQWTLSHYDITHYGVGGAARDTIYFDGSQTPDVEYGYYLTGLTSEIDDGEWSYNSANNKFYVNPLRANQNSVFEVGYRDTCIIVRADGVVIEDIEIRGARLHGIALDYAGTVLIDGVDFYYNEEDIATTDQVLTRIEIENCNFYYSQMRTIYISGCNNLYLHDNYVYGAATWIGNGDVYGHGSYADARGNAWFISESGNVNIYDNEFDQVARNAIFINYPSSPRMLIENNTISNAMLFSADGGAIYSNSDETVNKTHYDTIRNNTIKLVYGSFKGVSPDAYGSTGVPSAYGIYIDESTGTGSYPQNKFVIHGNKVDNTYTGIFIHEAEEIFIEDNEVTAANLYGILISDFDSGLPCYGDSIFIRRNILKDIVTYPFRIIFDATISYPYMDYNTVFGFTSSTSYPDVYMETYDTDISADTRYDLWEWRSFNADTSDMRSSYMAWEKDYNNNVDLSAMINNIHLAGIQSAVEQNTTGNATTDPNNNEENSTSGLSSSGLDVFQSQTGTVAEGTYAIEARESGSPTDAARVYIDLSAAPYNFQDGDVVYISLEARHYGSGGLWSIGLGTNPWSAPTNEYRIANLTSTETTFERYTKEFTYYLDSTQYLAIREFNASSDGGVYFDNLSIKRLWSPYDNPEGTLSKRTDADIYPADYYVATWGSDANDGSFYSPWLTWDYGADQLSSGDTLYIRGGRYYTDNDQTSGISMSGVDGGSGIWIMNYPGEVPVIDASAYNQSSPGVIGATITTSNDIHLKGLVFEHWLMPSISNYSTAVYVGKSDNVTVERCTMYDIGGWGVWVEDTCDNVLVKNNDIHFVFDDKSASPGAGADGITIRNGALGDTCYVIGNRVWQASDDGIDFIRDTAFVVVHDNWVWSGGIGAGGAGNGFKMGGSEVSDGTLNKLIYNNIAYNNLGVGFTPNGANARRKQFINNTSINNAQGFQDFTDTVPQVYVNNLAYGNDIEHSTKTTDSTYNNSWELTGAGLVTLNNDDFISIDSMDLYLPRKNDGSLPDINFYKLKSNSDMVDMGMLSALSEGIYDTDKEFIGSRPDIGYIEANSSTNNFIIHMTGSLTDGAPTAAQIDTIVGAGADDVGAGWHVIILDSDGTGMLYYIESDGTNWCYMVMAQAS